MGRFSIESFKATIDDCGGIAKPNRFFVSFTPPMLLGSVGREVGNKVEYFCEATNMPGYQLQTYEYRRYTYGPTEKRPFGPHSNPVQLTFIADGKGIMWKFFHTWMSSILEHDMQRGINSANIIKEAGASRNVPYEVEYKRNYITDLAIYHVPETYDETDGNPEFTSRTICFDAFPTAILDQQLNWSDNNNISRFGVQFDYVDFIINKLDSEQNIRY